MSSRLLLAILASLLLFGCGDESQTNRTSDPDPLITDKEKNTAEQEAEAQSTDGDDAEKLAKQLEEQGLTNGGSPLLAIALDQGATIIPQGAQTFWLATGVYEDESERDLSELVTWGTTDGDILSVLEDDPGGIFAEGVGNANVTAKVGEISTSQGMTVIP